MVYISPQNGKMGEAISLAFMMLRDDIIHSIDHPKGKIGVFIVNK